MGRCLSPSSLEPERPPTCFKRRHSIPQAAAPRTFSTIRLRSTGQNLSAATRFAASTNIRYHLAQMAKSKGSSKADVDPIGDFYTNHPYPPPVNNLDRARDLWQDENVHRAEFHLLWPHRQYRPDFNVLVAGCGTWQAAKFALCH